MTVAITNFVDIDVTLADASADKFGFGALMGVFSHSVTANRQDGPYASLAEVVAAGFTSVAAAEIHAWATAVFAQENGVDSVIIGRIDAGDANLTASLDAIEAAGPDTWYITTLESRVEAVLLLAAAWHETRTKILILQSLDAGILAGTGGNVLLDLQALTYKRTALIYHDTSTGADGYLDGAWASSGGGFNLDAPAGAGTWAFHELSGVTGDTLTSTEAGEVYDGGGNIYSALKGLTFTSKGIMVGGRFIDVTTSLDWLQVRIEEAIISAFVAAPTKIPYTSAGQNIIRAAVQGVFDQGMSFGHLSSDSPPTLTLPKIGDVSSANKQTRLSTGTARGVLSGGIHKFELAITVQQ